MNYVQVNMLRNLLNDFQARNRSSVDDALKNRMMRYVEQNPEKYQDFSNDMYQAMITGNTEEFMRKFGFSNEMQTEEQVEEEMKKNLNLEDVTQFQKDGHNYIKMQEQDGNVRIVENMENNTLKQEFENRLENPKYVSEVGKENAAHIFEDMSKTKIESNMQALDQVNKDQLSNEQLGQLQAAKVATRDDEKVLYDDQNGVVVAMNQGQERPKTLEVQEKNGAYVVNQLGESTYQTVQVPGNEEPTQSMEPQMSKADIQNKLIEMSSSLPSEYANQAKEIMRMDEKEAREAYAKLVSELEASRNSMTAGQEKLEEHEKVKRLVPTSQKGAINLPTYLLFVSASASAFFYLSLLYLKVLP